MKTSSVESRFTTLLALLVILLASSSSVFLQSTEKPALETPPTPGEEKFKASSDLLVPWRDGSCVNITANQATSGCYIVTAAQYISHTMLSLDKEDSSVWLTFDLDFRNDLYFQRKKDFIPFATPGLEWTSPSHLVLRISGESKHWYRVIVNEDNGTVAYVLKSDPEWWKSTF